LFVRQTLETTGANSTCRRHFAFTFSYEDWLADAAWYMYVIQGVSRLYVITSGSYSGRHTKWKHVITRVRCLMFTKLWGGGDRYVPGEICGYYYFIRARWNAGSTTAMLQLEGCTYVFRITPER
jgi:hypothetical protein